MPNMVSSRILYSSIPVVNDTVYAIGGSFEGTCEWYDIRVGKWRQIKGYDDIIPDDDFQTFALIGYGN